MAGNAFSLARARISSTLTRVTQVLDTFAARDRDGETLTAVRHYPAREAQWAEFPEWVHGTFARLTTPREFGNFTLIKRRRRKPCTQARTW